MISDGCGYNHVIASSLYAFGRADGWAYQKFPVRLAMATFPYQGSYDPARAWTEFAYVKKGATDSAAAATAMACGVKTYNGAIGVGPDKQRVRNILEKAEVRGLATGVVSSVPFSHATPAGFLVHNEGRGNYDEIALSMLNSRAEVIMGAGHPYYDDNAQRREKPKFAYIGENEWEKLSKGMMASDADGDGRPEVVVGTMAKRDRHGRVIALNPRTQKVLWETAIPGHIQCEPALTAGLTADGLDVLVTNWRGDKSVRALGGKDGKLLWTFAMKGDMYHGVSVLEQGGQVRILAASTAGDLTLLNGKGQSEWTRQPGGYLFAPTSAADVNGDGVKEIIVCSGKVHVYSLTGEELWRSPDFQSISRGVAVVQLGGRVVLCFGSHDRYFRVLEGATGKEMVRFNATVKGHVYEGIDSGPIVGDFDGDGQLEAFFVCGKGTSDQTQDQNYGRAYAVKLGPGQGAWPMFRGNLRRTGATN
jgi:outer membrane protein assembly factor BamB